MSTAKRALLEEQEAEARRQDAEQATPCCGDYEACTRPCLRLIAELRRQLAARELDRAEADRLERGTS